MADGPVTVLVLATTFPRWDNDTVPSFVYELVQQLPAEQIAPIVLAPHYPGACRREQMGGITVYRFPYFVPFRYQRLVFQGKGGILPALKHSHLAKLQIPLFFILFFLHTLWIIRSEDIDVVNAHWLVPTGIVGAAIASIIEVPHVLTLHARGVLFLKRIPLGAILIRYVYSRSDALLPVSTHIRDEFFRAGGITPTVDDQVQVQPMGAYTMAYDVSAKSSLRAAHDSDDEVRALYVGRLTPKKGVRYLLNAVAPLVDRDIGKSFHLFIVGSGPLADDLRDYADEIGVQPYVTFTGWISEEALREQYIMADFVVVPSIEAESGDVEGMPTVIAEAFASGNPVIATDTGDIPDVVNSGGNGFLVEQRDAAALADRMETLIIDFECRHQLSQRALATAETLDWSTCAGTYANAFERVAGTGETETGA